MPAPSAVHAVPFQRAMLLAGTPLTAVKDPPMTTSPLGKRAIAFTTPLSSPVANTDHDDPLRNATP